MRGESEDVDLLVDIIIGQVNPEIKLQDLLSLPSEAADVRLYAAQIHPAFASTGRTNVRDSRRPFVFCS